MINQKEMIEISPTSLHPLQASVCVPGSKSLTNRVLLIAALAEGMTVLRNALFSDDSAYFAGALQQLGFNITLDPAQAEMTVTGQGGIIPAHRAELFIGNAGTAARFLTAFLTLGNGNYSLDGDARMRERPIGDLVSALDKPGRKDLKIQPSSDIRSDNSLSQSICPPIQYSCFRPAGRAGRNCREYIQPVPFGPADGCAVCPQPG